MIRSYLVRRVAPVAVAALALLGAGTLAPEKAYAGTNGQQVCINSGWGSPGNTWIYGYNQNGEWVSWHGDLTYDWLRRVNSACTGGWWWKGYMHVDTCFSYDGGATCKWVHGDYDIPGVQVWFNDWYNITMYG